MLDWGLGRVGQSMEKPMWKNRDSQLRLNS